MCKQVAFSPLTTLLFHVFFSVTCSFFANCYVIMGVRTKDPFDELLHRYRGLLFSLCSHFRHRGLDTDDLIQEATIALWKNRERLLSMSGPSQAALTWKIARNAVIDTLRRIEDSEALPESYDQREEDRSLVEELHEVIAQLDEPDRTIVTMKLEGYSYKEIALKLDTTEKNVSVRLVRVKDKLRKEMTK